MDRPSGDLPQGWWPAAGRRRPHPRTGAGSGLVARVVAAPGAGRQRHDLAGRRAAAGTIAGGPGGGQTLSGCRWCGRPEPAVGPSRRHGGGRRSWRRRPAGWRSPVTATFCGRRCRWPAAAAVASRRRRGGRHRRPADAAPPANAPAGRASFVLHSPTPRARGTAADYPGGIRAGVVTPPGRAAGGRGAPADLIDPRWGRPPAGRPAPAWASGRRPPPPPPPVGRVDVQA